jgi:hypothetical protein
MKRQGSRSVVECHVEALVSCQTQPQEIGQEEEEGKPQTHTVEVSKGNDQKHKRKEERDKSPHVLLCREEISPHNVHSKQQDADGDDISHTETIDGVTPGDTENHVHDNPSVRKEVVRETERDLKITIDFWHVLATWDGDKPNDNDRDDRDEDGPPQVVGRLITRRLHFLMI